MIEMRKFFQLSFVLVLATLPALAQTSSPRPSQPPEHGGWLRTMEASMHGIRIPDSERTLLPTGHAVSGVFAWMGWLVAGLFLLGWLGFRVRIRRREKRLLRGSEDFFLLAPSGSRRQR